MSIGWLIGELAAGVLLAGVVLGVVVVARARWGGELGAWTPVVTTAVCVLAAVVLGERLRRRTGR